MLEKVKSKRHSASIYHIKLFYQPQVENTISWRPCLIWRQEFHNSISLVQKLSLETEDAGEQFYSLKYHKNGGGVGVETRTKENQSSVFS